MIAEDEEANFELLERIFKPSKVKIVWAKNGAEVIEYISEQKGDFPDLILMDIKMPVMNGIEAFHKVRKINAEVPVLAVTAFATMKEKIEIMEHNFTDFVTKPIKKENIIYLVNEYLGV